MFRFFKPLVDLLFYSNLWIACCALAMVWQTHLLLDAPLHWAPYPALVFCSTLCLYALHRVVGLRKLQGRRAYEGRYRVIHHFRHHIIGYAALAAVAGAWYFFQLPYSLQFGLLAPAFIALLYALPLLRGGRRLRDLHYLKIFLIALVWAWVTVALPALALGRPLDADLQLLFAERSLFILAITIPFDIRDLEIDREGGVRTLPAALGLPRAKALACAALLAAALLALLCSFYTDAQRLALWGSLLLAALVILYSSPRRHDYYYTGLVDGVMWVQFFAIYLLS